MALTELDPPRPLGAHPGWFADAARVGALGYASILITLSAVVTWYSPAPDSPYVHGPTWLVGWFHRDSGWYYRIVAHGYSYHQGHQSTIAFFPSYPLTVRAANLLIGDAQTAGFVVAVLAGFASVQMFARWSRAQLPPRVSVIAVLLLLLYPFSFYLYGPMYGDSLFLLTALLAFAAVDRERFLLAGVIGIAATAGRPVGFAMTAGLVVRALEIVAARSTAGPDQVAPQSLRALGSALARAPRREVAAALVLPGISVLGLVGWCAYLQLRFGDPLAWIHNEATWGQGGGPRTWFKVQFAQTVLHGPQDERILLLAQAACCLGAVLLLRRAWRLFGWGYTVYSATILLIAFIGTKDLMGTGRYILVAFPFLAAAADALVGRRAIRSWLPAATLIASAIALLVATSYYARGYPVS
jgi:hypothetical protein